MSTFPVSPAPVVSERWSHGWSTAWSVLLIVLGLIAVILPNVGGMALTLYFGWLLVLGGIAFLLFATRSHARGVMWFQIGLAILYLLIGLFLVFHPQAALATLTVVLAAYLFMEGVLELIVAFRARPAAGRGWLVMDGVIALVIAVMILASWPGSSVWAIGTLVGINLIFSGISRLMAGGAVRRHVRLIPGIPA